MLRFYSLFQVKNSDVPLRSMQVDARDMKMKGQAGNVSEGRIGHGFGLETTKVLL